MTRIHTAALALFVISVFPAALAGPCSCGFTTPCWMQTANTCSPFTNISLMACSLGQNYCAPPSGAKNSIQIALTAESAAAQVASADTRDRIATVITTRLTQPPFNISASAILNMIFRPGTSGSNKRYFVEVVLSSRYFLFNLINIFLYDLPLCTGMR